MLDTTLSSTTPTIPTTTITPTTTTTTTAPTPSSSTSHITTPVYSTHKEKGAASEKEDSANGDHNDSDSGSESGSESDRSSVHGKANKVYTNDDNSDEDEDDDSSHNSSTSSSSSESVVAKSQIPSKKARYVTTTTTTAPVANTATTSYASHKITTTNKNNNSNDSDDRHSFDHELDTIDVIQNMRMGKLKKSKVTISTSDITHTQSQEGHNSDLRKLSRKRTVELVDADEDTFSKPQSKPTNTTSTTVTSKPNKRLVIASDEPTSYTETDSSTTQRPSSPRTTAGSITIGCGRSIQSGNSKRVKTSHTTFNTSASSTTSSSGNSGKQGRIITQQPPHHQPVSTTNSSLNKISNNNNRPSSAPTGTSTKPVAGRRIRFE